MASTALTTVAVNDLGAEPEYQLFAGDHAWGWAGRIVIDGIYQGWQIVRWDTMTTVTVNRWHHVQHMINQPGYASLWDWTPTTDEYAADVLALLADTIRAQNQRRYLADLAAQVQAEQRAARSVAAHNNQRATYTGSITELHGLTGALGWCACTATCHRYSLECGDRTIDHMREDSFALVS